MMLRQDHPVETAAAKAGMSRANGYRISRDPVLRCAMSAPSQLRPNNADSRERIAR